MDYAHLNSTMYAWFPNAIHATKTFYLKSFADKCLLKHSYASNKWFMISEQTAQQFFIRKKLS